MYPASVNYSRNPFRLRQSSKYLFCSRGPDQFVPVNACIAVSLNEHSANVNDYCTRLCALFSESTLLVKCELAIKFVLATYRLYNIRIQMLRDIVFDVKISLYSSLVT